MVRKVTVLHTPGCPNLGLVRRRLADALSALSGPAPRVLVEEIGDPEDAARRGMFGSPTVLMDGVDPFASSRAAPAFACRTYRTESGVEGAPSVQQLVAALTAGR